MDVSELKDIANRCITQTPTPVYQPGRPISLCSTDTDWHEGKKQRKSSSSCAYIGNSSSVDISWCGAVR